jgi:hypothetical protein
MSSAWQGGRVGRRPPQLQCGGCTREERQQGYLGKMAVVDGERPSSTHRPARPSACLPALHIQRKESHLPPPRLPPACLAEEALADPYFTGLSQPSREPSAQPISKLAFEFERRKLVVEEVRRAVHAVLRCLLLCMRCSLIAAFLDLAPDPASCLPACPCLPACRTACCTAGA